MQLICYPACFLFLLACAKGDMPNVPKFWSIATPLRSALAYTVPNASFARLNDTMNLASHPSGVVSKFTVSGSPIYLHKKNGMYGYVLNLNANTIAQLRKEETSSHAQKALRINGSGEPLPWSMLDENHEEWVCSMFEDVLGNTEVSKHRLCTFTLREALRYYASKVSAVHAQSSTPKELDEFKSSVDSLFENINLSTSGALLKSISAQKKENVFLQTLLKKYMEELYESFSSDIKASIACEVKYAAQDRLGVPLPFRYSDYLGKTPNLSLITPDIIHRLVLNEKHIAGIHKPTNNALYVMSMLHIKMLSCFAGGWNAVYGSSSSSALYDLCSLHRHMYTHSPSFSFSSSEENACTQERARLYVSEIPSKALFTHTKWHKQSVSPTTLADMLNRADPFSMHGKHGLFSSECFQSAAQKDLFTSGAAFIPPFVSFECEDDLLDDESSFDFSSDGTTITPEEREEMELLSRVKQARVAMYKERIPRRIEELQSANIHRAHLQSHSHTSSEEKKLRTSYAWLDNLLSDTQVSWDTFFPLSLKCVSPKVISHVNYKECLCIDRISLGDLQVSRRYVTKKGPNGAVQYVLDENAMCQEYLDLLPSFKTMKPNEKVLYDNIECVLKGLSERLGTDESLGWIIGTAKEAAEFSNVSVESFADNLWYLSGMQDLTLGAWMLSVNGNLRRIQMYKMCIDHAYIAFLNAAGPMGVQSTTTIETILASPQLSRLLQHMLDSILNNMRIAGLLTPKTVEFNSAAKANLEAIIDRYHAKELQEHVNRSIPRTQTHTAIVHYAHGLEENIEEQQTEVVNLSQDVDVLEDRDSNNRYIYTLAFLFTDILESKAKIWMDPITPYYCY
ncbi:hypothetical protein NECID01_1788 [Nematocida sp. AWRm77]|nr:hypothetical protein NECID01_1788 [Nematocida sp. AWRm77]